MTTRSVSKPDRIEPPGAAAMLASRLETWLLKEERVVNRGAASS